MNTTAAQKKRIAIIGSGLGGLSAAAYLAKHDTEVLVFERSESLGGKLGEIKERGFRFDTGPSLFTMPQVFKSLFEHLGEDFEEHIQLQKLDPICRYFWDEDISIDSYHSSVKFQKEVAKISTVDADRLPHFLQHSQKIYEFCEPVFLAGNLSDNLNLSPSQLLNKLMRLACIDPLRTMNQSIERFFSAPEIRQLFSRYATYSGSSPYRAPATLNLIPHVEYGLGSFYIKGGIRLLVDRLVKLLRARGVRFFTDTHIQRVLNRKSSGTRKPQVSGVQDKDGNVWQCDAVISNADVAWTHRNLLNSKAFEKAEPSTSGVVFFWGIKGESPLEHHNIFFSSDYKQEFAALDSGKFPEDPTVYVNISSKSDPEDAPDGMENWFVMVNTPALTQEDQQTFTLDEVREAVVKRLKRSGIKNIEERIVFERSIEPKFFHLNHLSNRGSIYGISSNGKFQAFLRQASNYKKMNGFFFTGGSAHPGGGMPLVTLSGANAAKAARTYLQQI